jgi:hypothetical protein
MTTNKYPIASWAAAMNGDIAHAGMTSDDIVASEKAGQKDLVLSAKLPKKGNWDLLKEWGLTITDEADDLFYNVVLPIGWTKRETSHDLHSDLIDDQGRKRAGMFYKAAFYDRSATINPIQDRFYVGRNYGDDCGEDSICFDVKDAALDATIYKGKPGQYAFYTASPGTLGLVLGDCFYFDTYGKYDDARLTKSFDASLATLLCRDDFYKKYHHVKPVHDFIRAAENKAKEESEEYLKVFLRGRDQWSF